MVVSKIKEYQQSRMPFVSREQEENQLQEQQIDAKAMLEKMFVPKLDADAVNQIATATKEPSQVEPTSSKEESFTDVIMRKAVTDDSETFNLDDGVTYKFEE